MVRKKPDPNAPTCITPECGRKQYVRGLCNTCIIGFREAVKANVLNDAEAVAKGYILAKKPPGRQGRPRVNRWKKWVGMMPADPIDPQSTEAQQP